MGKATITISGKGLQDVKTLDMEIWVEAVVNIDARAAAELPRSGWWARWATCCWQVILGS